MSSVLLSTHFERLSGLPYAGLFTDETVVRRIAQVDDIIPGMNEI